MNEDLQSFFCVKASERIEKIITSRKLSFFEIYPENGEFEIETFNTVLEETDNLYQTLLFYAEEK